jgi:1,4-alpha-glucan branching enzyme
LRNHSGSASKSWHNDQGRSSFFIDWDSLDGPAPDPNVRDFNRFVRELIWLRRRHPALRGDSGCNPHYNHNGDRVLAFHRWVEGIGRDVIVVASLNEDDLRDYRLPLPVGGHFQEVFNASAYDTMPSGGGYNSAAPGNPSGTDGNGSPLSGCPTSARIVIPANGFLVFARDRGD